MKRAEAPSDFPTPPDLAISQRFLDVAPDSIVVVDHDGRITYVNAQTEQIFGYDASELLGKPVEILVPESRRATHVAERSTYQQAPVSRPMGQGRELVGRHKSGTEIPVEISLSAVTTDRGSWVMATIRDVRERRRAEAERARLQDILDSSINPIIYVDAATDHVRANPAAEHLFGHPFIPEAGRAQYSGQMRDPEGRLVSFPDLPTSRIFRGETPVRQEYLVVRPDGSRVPVVENAAPIRLPNGEITGTVMVFQDISRLKELERSREEWTLAIAHDLRQPMTVIVGYADRLAHSRKLKLSQAHAFADHIFASSLQLNRMIVDLLNASRIETKRLTLERRPIDLTKLVRSVVERAAALTAGHDVSVTSSDTLPIVSVDPNRIEQVLTNLLSNAAKYGAPGSRIEVHLSTRETVVEVAVTNQGQGIPPEELPAVFSRFYRAKPAAIRGTEGLGLGLYIAKGLVEAHGGRIRVESVPGATTTFRFTLPIRAAPPPY